MELVELSQEIERLFEFEFYLSFALSQGHKPLSAYFKYLTSLDERAIHITINEFEYCKKRISKLKPTPKWAFWDLQFRSLFNDFD